MEEPDDRNNLSEFLETGIFRFPDSNAAFIDLVRALNRSYGRFKLSPSAYYCRFLPSMPELPEAPNSVPAENSKKRRRREKKKDVSLNERERAADQRHQEPRPFLAMAQEALLRASELRHRMSSFRRDGEIVSADDGEKVSFVDLGRLWQAPLYEMTVNFVRPEKSVGKGVEAGNHVREKRVVAAFHNFVCNDTNDDAEAEFLDRRYIFPRDSSFHMSDRRRLIQDLITAVAEPGFHLIVIDPPWENASAHQKLSTDTLHYPIATSYHSPSINLPVEKGLLWHCGSQTGKSFTFLLRKSFFLHGEQNAKPDCSLLCNLDLFHHRPYEYLLLGHCIKEGKDLQYLTKFGNKLDKTVIVSVPGHYSRMPPVEDLSCDYMPCKEPRCVELFAREMTHGWSSWGNESLHFQQSRYFHKE